MEKELFTALKKGDSNLSLSRDGNTLKWWISGRTLDEKHAVPPGKWGQFFSCCATRYRWGHSVTPGRRVDTLFRPQERSFSEAHSLHNNIGDLVCHLYQCDAFPKAAWMATRVEQSASSNQFGTLVKTEKVFLLLSFSHIWGNLVQIFVDGVCLLSLVKFGKGSSSAIIHLDIIKYNNLVKLI